MATSALASLHRLQAHRCCRRASWGTLLRIDRPDHGDLGPTSRRRRWNQSVGRIAGRFDSMTNRRSKATTESSGTLDLDPILDFMRLLWSVEHGLQSTSKRMEATLGITGPQRLVLRIVTERPGLSAGEVARIVHLHPSTITGILQRLVRKGLLQCERDRRDTRRVRLLPSGRGEGFRSGVGRHR